MASGGLTFIVILVVVASVIVSFAIFHLKRDRTTEFRSRTESSTQRIHRLLHEAFNSLDDGIVPVHVTSNGDRKNYGRSESLLESAQLA